MNWYKKIKIASIWQVNYRKDSLSEMLYSLYELTYKYQYLQTHNFKGHPTRLQNILKNIESSAKLVIADIVDILQPCFEGWLADHAILSPKNWATKRAEDWEQSSGSSIESIANAILIETDKKGDFFAEIHRLDEPINSGQAPVLSKYFETIKNEFADLDEDENSSQNYDDMIFSDFYSDFYGGGLDQLKEFLKNVSQFYSLKEVFVEILQFVCFPVWYEFWKPQGIDQTRQRLENAYQMIKAIESQPIKQAFVNINIIINTCHQTGDMLDYITNYTHDSKGEIRHAMETLSNSSGFPDWDLDLQNVGLQLPAKQTTVNQNAPTENKQKSTTFPLANSNIDATM